MLNEGVFSGHPHVKLFVWHASGSQRPTFKEATDPSNHYEPAALGQQFGPSWSTHWFKVYIQLPEAICSKDHVELHWDCNNEGTVWTEDGKPLQGLTGRGERIEWIIPSSFKDGNQHLIYIEMACNGMFGNGPGRPIFKNNPGGDSIQPPDQNKLFALSKAEIVAVNLDARMLYMDIIAIHDTATVLPEESWQQHKALSVGTKIMNNFKLGDKNSIIRCRKIAEEFLGPQTSSSDIYSTGHQQDADVFAIGHCHIDTCWLWPWAETKRKVTRSWLNQCDLMDRYPELTFACSQAQQFQWLKEEYPYAWERVKEKVQTGQFQPIGGCWVEHDTNLPNGESLVRQFLYGQRFFEANFGSRSRVLWLPDSFGFSAQLPQLSRQAGMPHFLTQKICFNNINQFPHTTFNWVSLDGSQVLCHMPPVRTYTAECTVADVQRCVTNHLSMDQDYTSLMAFGKGDGGGGPTWQHLERLRRCRGVSDTVGLLPRVHVGGSADDFFRRLERKSDLFPTWTGELYFELHRGTYTTQSSTKKNNRRAEFLMRDIELLATVASIADSSYRYPKAEIDQMWQKILLCQFHDCLPGTAIRMCYDDSDQVYADVFKTGENVLRVLYQQFNLELLEANQSESQHTVALNTLPWHRKEIVRFSGDSCLIASGNGNLLALERMSPVSTERPVTIRELSAGVFKLQNAQLSLTVEKGCIISLNDRKVDRELIPLGKKANQFVVFDDKPIYWQAWDVEVYHLDTREELESSSTSITEDSYHRVSVTTETVISSKSSMRVTISLSATFDESDYSSVECTAEIDWHENMKFLKVEFPVDIRNTEASYETQYGTVRRPTHYNTSWDMAKFEVCCHKFADLSEHGYGVSILNDSKYGFATVGNVMRLSLLRSPKAPDDTADMGKHTIRWAIMPHAGALGARTVRAAFNFNNPLKLLVAKPKSPMVRQFPITLKGDDSLVLDTIKRGEDDEDISTGELPTRKGRSVIIRIYDSLGGRSRGTVQTIWKVSKVVRTNLLEDDEEEVPVDEGVFKVDLGPFQVCTYRLCLAD
ncbi:Alpha-mannosidase [Penicillium subrubescens]|uniref:Alpha-mannosidase n=2 Tax=Penicillium subrubescens TaxID=1316194 RepID=A0A1Q5TCF4_9EURO|nr:Alpha-mannosidase [Penicillium subrubescens]